MPPPVVTEEIAAAATPSRTLACEGVSFGDRMMSGASPNARGCPKSSLVRRRCTLSSPTGNRKKGCPALQCTAGWVDVSLSFR